MNGSRQSDNSIIAQKLPNNGRMSIRPAEEVERRELAKGNPPEQTRHRTQGRARLSRALQRIRQAVQRDPDARLTALWHHVYRVDTLREAYYGLNPKACPGVDEVTRPAYREALEANLQDLSRRLRRGQYRAPAVVRVYVPKPDGRQRPLGIPTLEDKLVQRAVTLVLNEVYEETFTGFSYGFRPKHQPHDALDALWVGLDRRKINWVYDADIQGYFDAIHPGSLVRLLQRRIGDRSLIRQIQKWLHAGVLEDGAWQAVTLGTPQGGSISPLLGNIYLHYALDRWAQWWREQQVEGDMIIVRFADDFVVGFQYEWEAKRFHQALTARLRQYHLTLHPTKTRLLEFGRFAASNRARRGLGKPETFDFLGFTPSCSHTRGGRFTIRRQTIAARFRRKLAEVKQTLRQRRHWSIPEIGRWLGSVVRGHFRYYGVPGNFRLLKAFRQAVIRLWRTALRRQSQRSRATWERLYRLARRWLPSPRIKHLYPSERLVV